jgi:hypothetical protein
MKNIYLFRSTAGIALAFLMLLSLTASAQTTFVVTVQPKTAAHPNFGNGGNMGYAINGVEGKELTLQRGVTYTFQMQNIPVTYPFCITTNPAGGASGLYYKGVSGNFVSGNGVLTFTPDSSAPDVLWYQSTSLHYPYIGWKINITGTASAPDDAISGSKVLLSEPRPNPAVGTTSLRLTVDRPQMTRVSLHDMTGKIVSILHDGFVASEQALSFDASTLPAGIYNCVAIIGDKVMSKRVVVGR